MDCFADGFRVGAAYEDILAPQMEGGHGEHQRTKMETAAPVLSHVVSFVMLAVGARMRF